MLVAKHCMFVSDCYANRIRSTFKLLTREAEYIKINQNYLTSAAIERVICCRMVVF